MHSFRFYRRLLSAIQWPAVLIVLLLGACLPNEHDRVRLRKEQLKLQQQQNELEKQVKIMEDSVIRSHSEF